VTAPHRKPVRLAAAVLDAAIDQDWPKTTRYIDRLNAECPGEGLTIALIAWCDTAAAHAEGGPPEFGRTRVASWDTGSGALVKDVDDYNRWARALVRARCEGDEQAFNALVGELNAVGDGWERGRYTSVLIQAVAAAIRSLPYGYARMGRPS
jgi:hypothetical protein